MPVNILVGLVALLVALVTYSIAVFGALRAKTLEPVHLTLLWVGFVFDVLATVMMALQIGGLDLRSGGPLLHTVLALAAMFGMLGSAAVGTWAYVAKNKKVSAAVASWVVRPWLVWVVVFVWGMATRGAARIGA